MSYYLDSCGPVVPYLDKVVPPNKSRNERMKFLSESQWWDIEKLNELRLEGLKQLVAHARERCTYYQDLPSIESLDDLKKIHILTKKAIHDNFDALSAKGFLSYKKWTGGTSEQVVILSNQDQSPFAASISRLDSWLPKDYWKKQVVIWGGGELGHRQPYKSSSFHWLYGRTEGYFFSIEFMTKEEVIVDYLRKMEDWNPVSIRGYASALRSVAFYALKYNIKFPALKCVVNNCEPLTEETRKIIREAFDVETFNFYGSQDLGGMGADCDLHSGLHLTAERYILEVTKDGRLIWTDLFNYAMPLIRYENGDIGKMKNGRCQCGRGLPQLESVVGRTLQYLYTKNGGWMNITEINEAMYYDVPNFLDLVEAHQVQQDDQGKIIVLLKVWDKAKLPNMTIIQRYFANHFDVEVQYVDEMKRSRSGKQLACITKFRPPWLNKDELDEGIGIERRGEVRDA